MTKVFFTDGTDLEIDKADLNNSDQEDNFFVFKDEDENYLYSVAISVIKYIEW